MLVKEFWYSCAPFTCWACLHPDREEGDETNEEQCCPVALSTSICTIRDSFGMFRLPPFEMFSSLFRCVVFFRVPVHANMPQM